MPSIPLWGLALAISIFSVANADAAPKCGPGSQCPQDAPCCSQYGQCGAGAYCLGGCDPMFSFDLQSCVAQPTCKTADYKLTSLDDIISNDKYLGDASQGNWVSEGKPQSYNGGVLLTMPPNSVGTLLSSTHYVWYGKISTTMKSSKGAGVVTAFIMMSDVKDEIDFEFIGADTQTVQSNYYWQGTLNYTNELNLTAPNTDTDAHTYTIDWQPDTLTWSVDNKVLRTLHKADTWNATTGSWAFPQTPSRIQLSLWPAGEDQNGPGTVQWAGGLIDWNSPLMTNGYYSALVTEVNVQCYDPPLGAQTKGTGSYTYTDLKGLNNSIAITNDNTVLDSLFATGDNPHVNPNPRPSSKGAPSSTSSAPPVNTNVETVPGSGGSGSRSDSGGQNTGSSSGASGGSAAGSDSGSASVNGGTANGEFSQGNTQVSEGRRDGVKGSLFAVLVGVVGAVWWL